MSAPANGPTKLPEPRVFQRFQGVLPVFVERQLYRNMNVYRAFLRCFLIKAATSACRSAVSLLFSAAISSQNALNAVKVYTPDKRDRAVLPAK
jgi:hypothetical protein